MADRRATPGLSSVALVRLSRTQQSKLRQAKYPGTFQRFDIER